MRSAMMELTGLDKVGDYTLLDNNGVQHITNRHAGGDGSADATMKNSADVARAAYVLNNFDNAYLAKDRAKGYKDSRGKRVPIVMFEKKIDGSHIIVEAVMDTKKSTNYIVSEYLSKNGVDEKRNSQAFAPSMDAVADPRDTSGTLGANHLAVTEAQQAPMDAASDPRHTSETFSAHSSTTAEVLRSPVNAVADPGDNVRNVVADPSAETSIAPAGASVNGNRMENSVETVKSTTADGMPSQSAQSAASSPDRATTTTAASGGNREELLGQRPAGHEGNALPEGDAGSRNPLANASAGAADAESYADVENRVDAAQLDTADWNRGEQRAAARQLVNRAQMTTKAAQAVVDAMPQGVGAAVYAQAANGLYRMGVTQDVRSFEQAVNLTGGMNSLGGAVRQVCRLQK